MKIDLTEVDIRVLIKALGCYSQKIGKSESDEDINSVYLKLFRHGTGIVSDDK